MTTVLAAPFLGKAASSGLKRALVGRKTPWGARSAAHGQEEPASARRRPWLSGTPSLNVWPSPSAAPSRADPALSEAAPRRRLRQTWSDFD